MLKMTVGAARISSYLPLLKGHKVGLFSNKSGRVNGKLTLDLLLENKVNVIAIFSPEHGFRGNADAGEHVSSSIDAKTGVPIYSLYNGNNGAPDDKIMQKIDLLIVDIQDVGLRFYTYYISMVKMMNACAIHNIQSIILGSSKSKWLLCRWSDIEYEIQIGGGVFVNSYCTWYDAW